MIPADVASRLQVAAADALRPVAPAQELADKLSDLVSGQRVLAQIQALLPNGTYRAIINQRDITLALPFSAKPGDSLELQVVDSDGKLTLAVASRPDTETTARPPAESVPTTLSRTGQLISDLFAKTGDANPGKSPTPLNGNQPIAPSPPATAQDILPLLKQAITQSGMFYESHQAEWVGGRMDKAALLQEPQGKLPPAHPERASSPQADTGITLRPAAEPAPNPANIGAETASGRAGSAQQPAQPQQSLHISHSSQLVAPEAMPLVQQQLEALATQNFSWQGQVWPGQQMHWEIDEEAARQGPEADDTANNWQTRLRLTLPHLGEVDAQIRLQGTQISLALTAGNAQTQELLRTSTDSLRSQFGDAGLALSSIGVGSVGNGGADG